MRKDGRQDAWTYAVVEAVAVLQRQGEEPGPILGEILERRRALAPRPWDGTIASYWAQTINACVNAGYLDLAGAHYTITWKGWVDVLERGAERFPFDGS